MSKASEHAFQIIRAHVLNGELAPGAQVKEEELAELCGVSRTPVREAMRRLESEAYLYRSETNRTFVSDWKMDDLKEIFTLRTMLEAHAAARAAERAGDDITARLRDNIEATRDTIAKPSPNIDRFYELNSVYHGLIVEAAGSERLASLLNRIVFRPIVQRTALRYDRAQLAQSLSEHEELVAAVAAGDPEWARAVMTAHIRRAFHIYASTMPSAKDDAGRVARSE